MEKETVKNYIIMCYGGHLKEPKYVHESGLFTSRKEAAERFDLPTALANIKLNLGAKVKSKAVYYNGFTMPADPKPMKIKNASWL